MILKNNLYKILSSDIEEKSYRLELIPDSMIYNAHFPEQPITPGVCIIQIASELLNEFIGTPIELSAISNAKFLAVISPDETKCVTYTFKKIATDETTGEIKVSAIVTDGDKVFTKLSLVYSKNGI